MAETVLEASATSTGTPGELWSVVADVTSWGEWVPAIESVVALDQDALGVGAEFRLSQPPLAPATYEVTSLEPGLEFTWVTSVTGATTCIRYAVAPDARGSRLGIDLWWQGFASRWVRRAMRERAQQAIDAQAATLAERANRPVGR